MHDSFAESGKSLREALRVPAVPLEAIRHAANRDRRYARIRLMTFSGAGAFAAVLVALAVGTGAGAKLLDGARVWLGHDSAGLVIRSATFIRQPTVADVRRAIAHATFPVTFPAGLRPGSRVTAMGFAPPERPSIITISYENGSDSYKPTIVLVDPNIVIADGSDPRVAPTHAVIRRAQTWTVRGERVIVADGRYITAQDITHIRQATEQATAGLGLAALAPSLAKMTIVGDPVRVALAEPYRPAGVASALIEQTALAQALAAGRPLLDRRTIDFRSIDVSHTTWRAQMTPFAQIVAVPVSGVRAIRAVFAKTGDLQSPGHCACEILIARPNAGAYAIWRIPLAGGGVRKFMVDTATFSIRSVTPR